MIATETRPVRYRIVIALDRSEYAELVLEHGLDQAARHDAPDLHFLTVLEARDEDPDAAKRRLVGLVLDGLETFRGDRAWRSYLHVRAGEPAREIADLASEVAADLLVIGRFGHRRELAEVVIERVTCPVLVVGLSGHALASEPPCASCAELREESDGTRWFCASHASPGRLRLSERLPSSSSTGHGGPLL
jgi:nucleotide-binding universal stress UspA family protein